MNQNLMMGGLGMSSMQCDVCGEEEDVFETLDPLALEILGEENECNLCDKCYENASDDI